MSPEFPTSKTTAQSQSEITAREESRQQEIRARLAEAKTNCPPDKEPFSIFTFQKLYDLTDDDGGSIISPDLVEDLEIQYYLKYRDIKSLWEFVALREELDAHNVG